MAKVNTQRNSQRVKCCGKSFVQRQEFIFGTEPSPPPAASFILLESGDYLLLESGSKIKLENSL
jgi:hypothetical protein